MSGCEWVYRYIFISKVFNIAIIRSEVWAVNQRIDHKLPLILVQYKIKGYWHQKGFIRGVI
jgi:hypothetical protein